MFKRSVIAMACIFPLSACGGGGGGSPDVKSADTPSKPAAPVVAENAGEGVLPKEKKDEEAAGGAPQADTQDATAGEGSQDMAAVSAENTGNGGAATTDNPKNEDAGAQNDMPQNAAESANQTGNNQPAGSSDSAPASNPAPANGGSDFGRTNVGNSVVIDGPSQNITLTHCKGDSCNGDNLLDEEAPSKSEFEKLSDEEKIKRYKKDEQRENFVGLVADRVKKDGTNKYIIFYTDKPPTRSARSRRSLPAEIPLIPVNQADTLIVDGEAVSLTGHSGNIFAPEGNYRYLTYGAEKLPGGSYALRVQGEPAKGEMLVGTAVYNGEVLHFHMENRTRPEAGLPQKSISAANLWTALSTAAMICIWVRKNSKPPSMETALRGLGRKMAAGMFPEGFTARPARKWRENTAIARQMLKRADSACLPAKKIGIDVDAARSAGIHYGGTTRSNHQTSPRKRRHPKIRH
ncbi:outer membrane protein [Neisseria gonorrhoeae]|nr:outer membrane protein [Neisseria gonorrhoeae]